MACSYTYIARTMEASGADICSEEFRNAVLRSISQYEDLEGVLYALAHIIESAVFSLGEARGCVASSATAYRNVFIGKALKVLSLCKGLVGIAAGKGFVPKESSLLLHVGLLYTCLAHLDVSFVCKSELDLNALIQDVALTISVLSIVQNNI
ncbi:hypothetical protein APHCRT_0953 [Anaplasma phagocytophilum str. CRT53-1]|uniref:Uncharacterized protein n=2 Tax=Anaplasma phagocytophilum TaxID=948 RepID=A0A0F3PZV1_ANAPH|nr:hypothetical protein P030_05040 [Anaplasma phagocytophilum str. CRT35]KJV85783.1 hypothetical protein APHCRT_0953 [Anaplasma phagocytophilum str. CRT53-1]